MPRASDVLDLGWGQDLAFRNTHAGDADAFRDYTLRSTALQCTVPGGPGDGVLFCATEKEKSLKDSKHPGNPTQYIFWRKKVTLAAGWRKDYLQEGQSEGMLSFKEEIIVT